MREEDPVSWHPPTPDQIGFWVVTRHADIRTVSKSPALFSSSHGQNVLPASERYLRDARMLAHMDPPEHAKYRRLSSRFFTPRKVEALRGGLEAFIADRWDELASKSEFDFASEIAATAPLYAMGEVMGIPPEERPRILKWSNLMSARADRNVSASEDESTIALFALADFIFKLGQQRRARPQDDVTSAIVNGKIDGAPVDHRIWSVQLMFIANGANETTRHVISHGLRLLLENPGQAARLRADPGLVPSAVEEMLRMAPPGMAFGRTAMADTTLAGQAIRQGDRVSIWLPSGNRDGAVFDEPDRFDVGRRPNEHLSFGVGQHFCLGANLARLTLQAVMSHLVGVLPSISLAGRIQRQRSGFADGIRSMPIRVG